MPTESGCGPLQERLSDATLARREAAAEDLAHVAGCTDCAAHHADLRALCEALESETAPPLAAPRAAAVRRLAAIELARAQAATVAASRSHELPSGYGRELLRILAWALLPLPAALFTYVQLFRLGGVLLGGFLPESAVYTLGALGSLVAASWLAAIYGSIPFLAHRILVTRQSEVIP